MATTRRDFLKQSAAASIAGMLPMAALAGEGLYETVGEQATEALFAGKPLDYWVARVTRPVDVPEFEDVFNQDALTYFGDAAVPQLIDAMSEQNPFVFSRRFYGLSSPSVIRLLTQALKERPKVRVGALVALHRIADFSPPPPIQDSLKEVLPVVVELLQDHDPGVRMQAEEFLCQYARRIDPSFSLPMDYLEHTDSSMRAIAVRQLGTMRPEAAIPRLVAKLQDPEVDVRIAAAEQLSHLDPDNPNIIPVFVEYLMHCAWIEESKFSGLAGLIIEALPVLRKVLENEHPSARMSVLPSLIFHYSEAELLEMFHDSAPEIRGQAVSAIKAFEAENADILLPYLIQTIGDKDDTVRHSALFAFGCSPLLDKAAVPRLIALLKSGEPCEQVSAALVLGHLHPATQQAVPALQRALEHPDSSVKLAAAIALATIQPDNGELAPILFAGLTHPDRVLHHSAKHTLWGLDHDCKRLLPRVIDGLMDPSTRRISAILLRRMGAEAAPAIPNLVVLLKTRIPGEDLNRNEVLQAFAGIGPLAIQPLLELLEHEEVFVRTGAMKALGLMGCRACSVVPQLIDKLRTGCPSERIVAIGALGNIGPSAAPAAVPALRAVIQDRDLAVRCRAIEALEEMKKQAESAIPDLCEAIKEPSLSTVIKWRALWTLKCIGPAAAPALAQALDGADAHLRAVAAEYFAKWSKS